MVVRQSCGSSIQVVEGGANGGNGGGGGDGGGAGPIEGLPRWVKIVAGSAAGGLAGSVLL